MIEKPKLLEERAIEQGSGVGFVVCQSAPFTRRDSIQCEGIPPRRYSFVDESTRHYLEIMAKRGCAFWENGQVA